MENSKIEWTDHTQNFWVGCTKVSPACDNCYAEGWAKRAGRAELWEGKRERTKDWTKPKAWNLNAYRNKKRTKVFTNSLSDFFDNQIPQEWRREAWSVIKTTPNLDWLILTKRPQNIVKMLPPDWLTAGYPNVWLGTTVENQEEAERRIPHLLDVPAVVHFLSCEPLLGQLQMEHIPHRVGYGSGRCDSCGSDVFFNALTGDTFCESCCDGPTIAKIDWIITGGEDFPRAGRIPEMQWFRDIRDECAATGVSFFMKQVHKHSLIPSDLMIRQFPKV